MEMIANRNPQQMVLNTSEVVSRNGTKFIEANTKSVSLNHLRKDCTIPVFAKDNESTISHFEFIDATYDLVRQQFPNELINELKMADGGFIVLCKHRYGTVLP